MAPFGPVLDMVAKLNSTKSFCWLKEKIVITTAQVRGHQAPRAPGVPHPQSHITSAFPLALKATQTSKFGKKKCTIWSPHLPAICFSRSTLSSEEENSQPKSPRKRCAEQFLLCYLLTQRHFRGPADVHMWVTLRINGAPYLSEEEEIWLWNIHFSVVRKQLPCI